LLEWLLPVSLATTNRSRSPRRCWIAASASDHRARAIHRRALVDAPSRLRTARASQLTGGLTQAQSEALEALLAPSRTRDEHAGWARLPRGTGHAALKRLAEQLACLRAVGLDPHVRTASCRTAAQAGREGARFTAQHLRMLSPLRRRATLVATVLDTTVRLTDDGVALFDRRSTTRSPARQLGRR